MKVPFIACCIVLLLSLATPGTGDIRLLQPYQCTVFVSEDCLDKEMPRIELLRKQRGPKNVNVCVNRTREHLIQQLKNLGGFNTDFVGADIFDTLNFRDPAKLIFERTNNPVRKRIPRPKLYRKNPKTTEPPTIPYALRYMRLGEDSPGARLFKRSLRNKHHRSKRETSRVISCKNAGDPSDETPDSLPEGTAVHHMCASCHYTKYQPTTTHFPPYLNERVCGHLLEGKENAPQGASDKCLANSGSCLQRGLTIKGLVMKGYTESDGQGNDNLKMADWESEDVFVRTSCECRLFEPQKGMLVGFQNAFGG